MPRKTMAAACLASRLAAIRISWRSSRRSGGVFTSFPRDMILSGALYYVILVLRRLPTRLLVTHPADFPTPSSNMRRCSLGWGTPIVAGGLPRSLPSLTSTCSWLGTGSSLLVHSSSHAGTLGALTCWYIGSGYVLQQGRVALRSL